MSEMKNESEQRLIDPDRAAYMIAWRDRYIERLQERLAGREEENEMLSTLLFGALFRMAETQENGDLRVLIPTKAVAELLGSWKCHTVIEGENYAVRFTSRHKEACNAEESGRE